jgi:uncharacterized protein YlzI (FlbEa/FlbD family)
VLENIYIGVQMLKLTRTDGKIIYINPIHITMISIEENDQAKIFTTDDCVVNVKESADAVLTQIKIRYGNR